MLAVLAAAVVLGSASPGAPPCAAPLPLGPAVPAPIVFRTGCGGFRLETSGRVTRLPRGWLAGRGGGTGRRYGADLQLRRNPAGRIDLLRQDQLVWRSRDLYPNDAAGVAFGPNAFAFASYRRGVFVTDLGGPERLVLPGRGLHPYAFLRSGRLLVVGARAVTVLTREGDVERRYRYGPRGLAFDAGSGTLYFVTPGGRLATVRESRLRVGRRLAFDGSITLTPPGLLLFYGERSLSLSTRDGRLLAQARWPRGPLRVLDSGASVSGDGTHVAFRLTDATPGAAQGNAVLFVLRSGETSARPLYRHRLGRVGCGTGANMRWQGRYLLYSSADGQVAIVDATNGRLHDLSRLASALPRLGEEQPLIAWARDYGR